MSSEAMLNKSELDCPHFVISNLLQTVYFHYYLPGKFQVISDNVFHRFVSAFNILQTIMDSKMSIENQSNMPWRMKEIGHLSMIRFRAYGITKLKKEMHS